jgi:hypothetical protein
MCPPKTKHLNLMVGHQYEKAKTIIFSTKRLVMG